MTDPTPTARKVLSRRQGGGRGRLRGTAKAKWRDLNDLAYAAIKNDIISCALPPGAEIAEGLLTARYGFGKAPVRSALVRLRQDGFVVSRGRRGNIVAFVTLNDIREIYQLRLILEVAAIRLAAGRVDRKKLMELDEAVKVGHGSSDRRTDEDFFEANREFHRYVVEASGNRRLSLMVMRLIEQHERIVHLGLTLGNRERDFLHRHDELIEALVAGDADRAAVLAEQALRGGQEKVMMALMTTDDEFSTRIKISQEMRASSHFIRPRAG